MPKTEKSEGDLRFVAKHAAERLTPERTRRADCVCSRQRSDQFLRIKTLTIKHGLHVEEGRPCELIEEAVGNHVNEALVAHIKLCQQSLSIVTNLTVAAQSHGELTFPPSYLWPAVRATRLGNAAQNQAEIACSAVTIAYGPYRLFSWAVLGSCYLSGRTTQGQVS
jgi:hypothetical protein